MGNIYAFSDESEKGVYSKPIQELPALGRETLYRKIHKVLKCAGFVDMDDIETVLKRVLDEVRREQEEAQRRVGTWLQNPDADAESESTVTVVDDEQ